MDAEEVIQAAKETMQKASDDAHRARLAFTTGNQRAYMQSVYEQAMDRMNAAYDALDGPKDDQPTEFDNPGTTRQARST